MTLIANRGKMNKLFKTAMYFNKKLRKIAATDELDFKIQKLTDSAKLLNTAVELEAYPETGAANQNSIYDDIDEQSAKKDFNSRNDSIYDDVDYKKNGVALDCRNILSKCFQLHKLNKDRSLTKIVLSRQLSNLKTMTNSLFSRFSPDSSIEKWRALALIDAINDIDPMMLDPREQQLENDNFAMNR